MEIPLHHANLLAFEGEFLGKDIKVTILEPEDGTKLLGPAAWNNIYIL